MKTFISLLRGINVGGQKIIRMEELRSLYQELGVSNIRTYVQSGNVIFDSTESDVNLSELIENQIMNVLGYSVLIFLRDSNDFQRIIKTNPFTTKRNEDPSKLHVTFLYRTPSQSLVDIPDSVTDEFHIEGKEIYLFCPDGYGRTKLTNSLFERKLNIPCTTRNWKTVNALNRMANDR